MKSTARHILLRALLLSVLPPLLVGSGYAPDEDCPCSASTLASDTCTCPIQITTHSGFPVDGDCEPENQDCGRDRNPCEWKGVLSVLCPGTMPIAKVFDLATDCGALPTVRQIKCTGGSGSINLSLHCEQCP